MAEQEKGNSTAAETTTDASEQSTAPTQHNTILPGPETATAESQSSVATSPLTQGTITSESPPSSSTPANVSNAPPQEGGNAMSRVVTDNTGRRSTLEKENSGETTPKTSTRTDDVYIAVIGPTGTGKTTFVNEATGSNLVVGHELESCTQTVEVGETTFENRKVKLIDTPGFDDGDRSDTEILEIIGDFLQGIYPKILLTGVIYLRRIVDNRMQGSAIRNLRVLEKLCGEAYYGNIVLVTTHWSQVKNGDGDRHENRLRVDRYWGEFIKHGATICRHTGGKDSALSVVKHLLQKSPEMLEFQRELAEHGIVGKTSAGQALILDLAREAAQSKKEIKKLQEELKAVIAEKRDLEANVEAYKGRMEKKLDEVAAEQGNLEADVEALKGKAEEKLKRVIAQKGCLEADVEALKRKVAEKEECIQNLNVTLKQRAGRGRRLRIGSACRVQ